jgi:hypothetical protein
MNEEEKGILFLCARIRWEVEVLICYEDVVVIILQGIHDKSFSMHMNVIDCELVYLDLVLSYFYIYNLIQL